MKKRGIFAPDFKVDDSFIEKYLKRLAFKKYPKFFGGDPTQSNKEEKSHGKPLHDTARRTLESIKVK